jgi:CRISPR-associated exonuclease Cas4
MIAINLIRQYMFCPRIVYFNLFTNIKPVYPKHVKLGIDYHFLQQKLLSHRKFKKLHINYRDIIIEKYLEDEVLDIDGKVDMAFICDDEIVPVEFKFIDKKPSISHKLQLVGYSVLLEKHYNLPVKNSFIIYGNNVKFYKVIIDEKLKTDFFVILNRIKDIENSGVFPNSSASEKQCSQCEYLNFCDDRF